MQLVVDNIAKSFGIHSIFKNVSFTISKGEKVGFVLIVQRDINRIAPINIFKKESERLTAGSWRV